MKTQHLLQVVFSAIAFTLFFFILELISGHDWTAMGLIWQLLANLLIVSVLGYYVVHSQYISYKLLFATFVIGYVIGNFNIVIEALIFGIMEDQGMVRAMLMGIPYNLLGVFLMIRIFGRWDKGAKTLSAFRSRKVSGWVGRILLANFLYIFFYLAAGILVQELTPGFEEFYEGKLPSPELFFMTNMGFRGFVFVAIAILIDRSLAGSRLGKAIFVGLVFSIIGGVAPLIPPNELMPEFIRVAHGFEVGFSNFFYGICVLLIVRSKEEVFSLSGV